MIFCLGVFRESKKEEERKEERRRRKKKKRKKKERKKKKKKSNNAKYTMKKFGVILDLRNDYRKVRREQMSPQNGTNIAVISDKPLVLQIK